MRLDKYVSDSIRQVIMSLYGIEANSLILSHPLESARGDFATNIAFQLSGKIHKSPKDIAEEIATAIKSDEIIDDVKSAGNGFVNFTLSINAKIDAVGTLEDTIAALNDSSNSFLVLEYGQPNTHKKPHIGHLFSYIYGESLARLLKVVGNKVVRVNYQGDVGPHVAKCLWALQKNQSRYPSASEQRVELLQTMYQDGSAAYKNSDLAKTEIDLINTKIYQMDEKIFLLWKETRQWCLDYYAEFEDRLGIVYDKNYFESEMYEQGLKLVTKYTGSIFEKSDGAIVYRGSKVGLHDRVFVTGRGTATYEAKDLALELQKVKDFPLDLAIITTAHEQNEYFKVVFSALEEINPQLKGKLKHIGFGMVNLKEGKMSSRTGEIVGAIDLVNTVLHEILHKFDVNDDLAEQIAIGAVKYSLLKSNPSQDITFDIHESIAQEGNSGPYIQYTHARCLSILGKAEGYRVLKNYRGELTSEEAFLLAYLYQFPEHIEHSAQQYAPHVLANYLFELAKRYNSLYQKSPILVEKVEEKRQLRLFFTKHTSEVLKLGLYLLGIDSPDKM